MTCSDAQRCRMCEQAKRDDQPSPDDTMTCQDCGGWFVRSEGWDTPVPLCVWCFAHGPTNNA